MSPSEIWELSFAEIEAVKRGYELRMRDQEKIAIEIGYWSGYYNRAKRPKSPQSFIEKIERASSTTKTTVDMDAEVRTFKEREERLKNARQAR